VALIFMAFIDIYHKLVIKITPLSMTLENEFIYFLDNQEELAEKYFGRYIVIKDSIVWGDFTSREDAAYHAINDLKLPAGTFLVQRCIY
jgi:hypothetical protein